MEEVAVRLFLMSVMAWIVSRFTKRTGLAFAIALVGSALFFALLPLGRPFPDNPGLANTYRAALMTKYALAGVPLGWTSGAGASHTQSSAMSPRMRRISHCRGVSSEN
jgi:hypothetical protein